MKLSKIPGRLKDFAVSAVKRDVVGLGKAVCKPHLDARDAKQVVADRNQAAYDLWFKRFYNWHKRQGMTLEGFDNVMEESNIITLQNHGSRMKPIAYSAVAGYELGRDPYWLTASSLPEFLKIFGSHFFPRQKDIQPLIDQGEYTRRDLRRFQRNSYGVSVDLALMGHLPVVFPDAGRVDKFDPKRGALRMLVSAAQSADVKFSGLYAGLDENRHLFMRYFKPVAPTGSPAQRADALIEYLQDTVGAAERDIRDRTSAIGNLHDVIHEDLAPYS